MQQCFSEILLDGSRASCFGLMGASHFEKAVRGGFALIDFLLRVESPKATLIFTDSCARRVPCTPLRSGARRVTKVSAVAGSRANRLCAPRGRGVPRDSEITYGGRLVLRSLGRQKWRPIFTLLPGSLRADLRKTAVGWAPRCAGFGFDRGFTREKRFQPRCGRGARDFSLGSNMTGSRKREGSRTQQGRVDLLVARQAGGRGGFYLRNAVAIGHVAAGDGWRAVAGDDDAY